MATPTETIATARLATRPGLSLRAQAAIVLWGTILAAVVAWQLAATIGPLAGSPYIAPPSAVLIEGMAAVLQPEALHELANTTARFFSAFAIVVVAGVPLGVMLGRLSRGAFAGSRDVVSILYALPMVPFYPLLVLWLGLGAPSEIAFGVLHGIIPLVLIVMVASHSVRTEFIASAAAMGASRAQRLTHIVFPATLPDIVGGLKIAASLTMLGVLLAELMISVDGVGSFIARQIVNQQAAPLDAMILVVCIGVVVIVGLLSFLERRLTHDH
jgi:NitT/TauT family transport system permease protein